MHLQPLLRCSCDKRQGQPVHRNIYIEKYIYKTINTVLKMDNVYWYYRFEWCFYFFPFIMSPWRGHEGPGVGGHRRDMFDVGCTTHIQLLLTVSLVFGFYF